MFFLYPSTIAIVPMELISLIHKFNNRKWCIAVNILTILRSFSNCINHSRVLTTCNQILVHIWMKFFIFYFNQIIILGDETEFIKTLFVIQFMIIFFHWSIIFQLISWFETYLLKVKKLICDFWMLYRKSLQKFTSEHVEITDPKETRLMLVTRSKMMMMMVSRLIKL